MHSSSRRSVVAMGLATMAVSSCKDAIEPTGTADFGATGVAIVTGRVLTVSGTPLDSFRVAGGVPNGGQALYSQGVNLVTGADGRFTLRVERSFGAPPISPDSVILRLGAQSLAVSDRNPDGSARLAHVETWITFAIPPRAATTHIVDIIVAGIR
ncbi:MAG: hypothetical protein IT353_07605 [Gemmatimonadaceae bacterium]|nr:hypothetical protein [Gemmatimonadaceae bacterium]